MPEIIIEEIAPESNRFRPIFSVTIPDEWVKAILHGGRIVVEHDKGRQRHFFGPLNDKDQALNLLRRVIAIEESKGGQGG